MFIFLIVNKWLPILNIINYLFNWHKAGKLEVFIDWISKGMGIPNNPIETYGHPTTALGAVAIKFFEPKYYN